MAQKFISTTAQRKISALRKRVRIIQGGAGASKTFSIIPLLIQYALQYKGSEISIVSETIPHLRRGALRDFEKIMNWTNNFRADNFNKSTLTYKFTNGSFIEFFSADQPDKLRGARRDVLFINECNNVQFEAYQELASRTRETIYLDFNPVSEFWVHTELKNDPDVDLIVLNYKDNEALEPALIAELEKAKEKAKTSSYWANYWRVYGLGEVGYLQGVIFDNWSSIDTIPSDAKYIGTGLDFGFTNDPTASVDLYKYNGKIIADEVIYQTGLHNRDIAKMIKGKIVYADSAEPKSISELRLAGVQCMPATKGADSIRHGIDLIHQHDLLVTKRSVNLIKELRNYTWDKDRNGKELNKPIDFFNHAVDAMRYAFQMTLGSKAGGNYDVR